MMRLISHVRLFAPLRGFVIQRAKCGNVGNVENYVCDLGGNIMLKINPIHVRLFAPLMEVKIKERLGCHSFKINFVSDSIKQSLPMNIALFSCSSL
jgi:hypothetical protein